MQQSASRTYEGINDRKRSCPAVSHSCSLTVSPSICSVLVTKSIPTVGYRYQHSYGGGLVEFVVNEPRYDRCLANVLVAHQHHLELVNLSHLYIIIDGVNAWKGPWRERVGGKGKVKKG
jgi:hypothetical protein